MESQNKLTIYCDGGSRGNPGPSAYGFVITKDNKLFYQEGKTVGITTNNVAEYTAVVQALTYLLTRKEVLQTVSSVAFFLDSLLAVSQLNGLYKIKQPHLRDLIFKIRTLEQEVGLPITYSHVRREKNKQADAMVNAALDNKTISSVE